MFITFILLPSDDIPEEVWSIKDTFSEALKDADRLINYYGGARKLEIYEGSNMSDKNKKLIASLRIVR